MRDDKQWKEDGEYLDCVLGCETKTRGHCIIAGVEGRNLKVRRR